MKKFLMAAAIATVVTAPASAADEVMGVGSHDWSGIYIGTIAGYGWGNADWDNLYGTYSDGPGDTYKGNISDHDIEGGLAGVTVGYNLQHGYIVYGLEADASFTDINGQSGCKGNNPNSYFATCSTDMRWSATLAGRLGIAMDRTLFFGKGGLAVGHFEYNISDFVGFTAPAYNTSSETLLGYVIGAGVEHAITDTISASLEYNYMDFGTEKVGFSSGCGYSCYSADFETEISQSVSVVKAGIKVHF